MWILKNHAETRRRRDFFGGGIWSAGFEEPRKDAETQRNAKIFLMVEFGMQVLKNHAKTQRREGTQRFFLDFNLRVKFHLLGP